MGTRIRQRHGKDTPLLALRRRLQSRGNGRPNPRLLPRGPSRLSAVSGQLGAMYAIPIIYVPVLMITHVVAFYLLLRPQPKAVRVLASDVAAS